MFGKSLLTITLDSFFKGQKELFMGLKILEWETEWEQYPVIHVNLNVAKRQPSADELRKTLMWLMDSLCRIYGCHELETSSGKC